MIPLKRADFCGYRGIKVHQSDTCKLTTIILVCFPGRSPASLGIASVAGI